jgi:hypothetical protein
MAGDRDGDGLQAQLVDGIGDGLRTAALFDPDSYDVLFVRDDVADAYPQGTAEEIHREQLFAAMHKDYREQLFHAAGALDSTVHLFDDVVIFRILNGDSGLFLSVDRTPSLDVDGVCAFCRDVVDAA